MPVEYGQLIDKSRLAGAYVVCLLGISGQDREGWLVLADGLLTLGIAPLRKLQHGVVEVVLHRDSPASGTSGGVCFSCCHLPLGHIHPADPGSDLCPVAISLVLCPALGFEP